MSIRHSAILAIAAILFADFMLTYNDALVKQAQEIIGLWGVFWLRALVSVPLLLGYGIVWGIFPKAPVLVCVRSVLLATSWIALYSAFKYMPISTAVAVVYSNPIIVGVATALLDRRPVSAPLWGAIALGFVGALLIVQPQMGGNTWAYLLPFICAATYAAAMVMTARALTDESPATLSLGLNLAFMGIGFVGVILSGQGLIDITVQGVSEMPVEIATMGIIVAGAAIFAAYAFQNAPAPIISVFDYSYLLFAVFWGYVFFGEIPNALAVIGMICIVGAGGLTIWSRSPKQTP